MPEIWDITITYHNLLLISNTSKAVATLSQTLFPGLVWIQSKPIPWISMLWWMSKNKTILFERWRQIHRYAWKNILYHSWIDRYMSVLETPRPYIPPSMRGDVFHHFHDQSPPGGNASWRTISAGFVWPGMATDIKQWNRACIRGVKPPKRINTQKLLCRHSLLLTDVSLTFMWTWSVLWTTSKGVSIYLL